MKKKLIKKTIQKTIQKKNQFVDKNTSADQKNFEKRKRDHINLALNVKTQSQTENSFNQIRLIHEALPEINLEDVDLSTSLLDVRFNSPHFVSSMTAGHAKSTDINLNLAQAAGQCGWLMSVGSQRKELSDSLAQQEWRQIQKKSPETHFVGNIGLEELIQTPLDQILKLIESIEAIGFFVHVNPLQEALQKKNQALFKGGLKAIEALCLKSSVPIIIKEVGFGFSELTMKKLFSVGVHTVDLAGKGGTHWGILEGYRNETKDSVLFNSAFAFKDWGSSTVECLLKCQTLVRRHSIWASGGVRSGVDAMKCLALGAQAVGIAQPLMVAAVQSKQHVLSVMERLDYELKVAMFCTGVVNLKQLHQKKVWYESKA